MGNVSFEEFYYSKDNQIHDISEVQKEYDQCSGDISKFKNQMFCPECKKAKLSFTHRTSFKRAFLSKKRSSDHVEGCSFIHDSASKRDILEYIKQLSTNQIQDRLEAALNQLLLKKSKADNDASNECKDNPLVIKVDNPRGSGIRKFIPRKSINLSLSFCVMPPKDLINCVHSVRDSTVHSSNGRIIFLCWCAYSRIFRNLRTLLKLYLILYGNIKS